MLTGTPTSPLIAIVDSSVLYGAIDADDQDHERCAEVLTRRELELVIPALVVAQVCYFVGKKVGAQPEAAFLRSLTNIEVDVPGVDDWSLIADLVDRYRDFPLGGTDASVAVLAERLNTQLILTLDRRHFGALRTSDGRPFTLLPD